MFVCQHFTFTSKEGDKVTSPSSIAKTWGLSFQHVARSAHCNIVNVEGMRMSALDPWKTNCLSANLLFLTSEEGDEATSLSFVGKT